MVGGGAAGSAGRSPFRDPGSGPAEPEPQGSPFNTPKTIEIEGRSFQVRKHNLAERFELDALVKELAPSPIDLLKRDAGKLPADVAKEVMLREFREAHAETRLEWPAPFRSMAWWNVFLTDFEHQARLVLMALRSDPHAAKLSLDDVRQFVHAAYGDPDKDWALAQAMIQFVMGPPSEQDPYDPKAYWQALTGLPLAEANAKLMGPLLDLASAISAESSPSTTSGPAPKPSASSPKTKSSTGTDS